MSKLKINIIKCYSISIGILIIISWISILLINNILPEGKIELTFHILSEFIMGIICLTGGIYIHFNRRYGFYLTLIAMGMLIYSTLNAAGYYLENNNSIISFLMSILFITTVLLIVVLIKYITV